MDLHLADKATLVTGGANGIRREIALALGAEGAPVAVNSAEAAQAVVGEIAANGGRAIACDVSDLGAVTTMVTRVTAELGQLDILVPVWRSGIPLGRRPRRIGGDRSIRASMA